MTTENVSAAAQDAAADAVTVRQVVLGFVLGAFLAVAAGALSRFNGDRPKDTEAIVIAAWIGGFFAVPAWPKFAPLVKWLLSALPTLIKWSLILGIVGGILWGIGSWLFAIPSWAAVIIVLLALVVLK